MKLKLHGYLFICGFFFLAQAQAAYTLMDLEKIKNDKEAITISVSKSDVKKIRNKFTNNDLNQEIINSFGQAVLTYLNSGKLKCELNLITAFRSELDRKQIHYNEKIIVEYLKFLRVTNHIDDLLYDFAVGINKDVYGLKNVESNKNASPGLNFYSKDKVTKDNDVKDLYRNFSEWPDEEQQCVYQEFSWVRDNLTTKHKKPNYKKKLTIMRRLNVEALKDKLVSSNSFRKLEYLRKESFLNTRYISLEDYFDIVFKAKNKMRPINSEAEVMDIEKEDKFSTDQLKRWSKLTRRKSLYEKYDETQIILLSQVLQNASRRMGTDPDVESGVPFITQEFQILTESGEMENYVERIDLDPQSQYNLARRRMRKDILDLQVMDIFYKIKIHYTEVIMAALETGYITHEDIEYVVAYDDLWNPATTKFERVMKFIFNTARVATFFVPTPFNITASIAITIVEGVVASKTSKGADNDNPASIID